MEYISFGKSLAEVDITKCSTEHLGANVWSMDSPMLFIGCTKEDQKICQITICVNNE